MGDVIELRPTRCLCGWAFPVAIDFRVWTENEELLVELKEASATVTMTCPACGRGHAFDFSQS